MLLEDKRKLSLHGILTSMHSAKVNPETVLDFDPWALFCSLLSSVFPSLSVFCVWYCVQIPFVCCVLEECPTK